MENELLKLDNQQEAVGTCSTLIYGQLGNSFAAIKQAKYFYKDIRERYGNYTSWISTASNSAIKTIWGMYGTGMIVLFSTDKESILGREDKVILIKCTSSIPENEVVSDEWLKEIGANKLIHTETLIKQNRRVALADVYIPLVTTADGSYSPVLWIEQVGEGIEVEESILVNKEQDDVESDKMYRDAINLITEKYPAVDLDTEEDKRFISIALNTRITEQVVICYNRNHSAFNDKLFIYDVMYPIVLAKYSTIYEDIEYYYFDILSFSSRRSEHFKVHQYQILKKPLKANGSSITPSLNELTSLT